MPKNEKTRRAGNFAEEQRDGLQSGNESPFEADTYSHCNDEESQRARTLLLVWEGRSYVCDCPDSWNAAQAHVFECVLMEKPIVWHDVASAMLGRDYINYRTGGKVGFDNTLGPLFMRWLAVLYPEAKPFMRLRRSMFDDVPIGGPYD